MERLDRGQSTREDQSPRVSSAARRRTVCFWIAGALRRLVLGRGLCWAAACGREDGEPQAELGTADCAGLHNCGCMEETMRRGFLR